MEPRFDRTIGEYTWPSWDYTPHIPPIFGEPFKLRTTKVAIFQGVLMIAFMVLAMVFKTKHCTLDGQCSNLTVLLFTQVALWTISFIYHNYYSRHHAVLRMAGYNNFSTKFSRKSSYLLYVLTCCNAVTLLYLAASIKYAPTVICDWECPYSALNLMIYSTLIHGVLFLAVTFRYICAVRIFNEMNPVPETVAAQGLNMAAEATLDDARNEMLSQFISQQSFLIDFYRNVILEIYRRTGEQEYIVQNTSSI